MSTVETHIKEHVFIRTSRLKFPLLNPLNKKPEEAEIEKGFRFYMIGFMLFELKMPKEQKQSFTKQGHKHFLFKLKM